MEDAPSNTTDYGHYSAIPYIEFTYPYSEYFKKNAGSCSQRATIHKKHERKKCVYLRNRAPDRLLE